MSKKFVAENRYKKTTRTKAKLEKQKEKKKTNKYVKIAFTILTVITIILITLTVIKVTKENKLLSKENAGVSEFKTENKNSFKIGVNKLATKQILLSNNLYVHELNKYVYTYLLKVDKDYNIIYDVAKEVQKINNAEYVITLNGEAKIDGKALTIYDLKNSIEQLIKIGNATPYYKNISHITAMEVVDESKLKINLNGEDPYFVYKLEIPILPIAKYNDVQKVLADIAPQNLGGIYSVMQTDESIIYERNKEAANVYPEKLELLKLDSSEVLIDKFKKDEIDMFFTTVDNLSKELGKYEYNLKQIRSGKSIFVIGNMNSPWYSNKEVRKALSYSINRSDIIEDIYKGKATSIDVPYIYSENKVRYDTIAANNTLVNNGFEKSGGLYAKEGKELRMKMLVSAEDAKMQEVARYIKSSAEECGIRIDIDAVRPGDILYHLRHSGYDLALTKIEMNQIPNIGYINSYIAVTDPLKAGIEKINNSDVKSLPENVRAMQKIILDEMPIIGITSESILLVAKKDIKGLDSVSYLNVFRNLDMLRKK